MDEERDIVVFTDEDGNDFELEVMDYFFYNGQEYAVLSEPGEGDHEHCGDEDCEHCGGEERDVYIMKVVPSGDDMEEFVPVAEDQMEQLARIVQSRYDDALGDDDDDWDDDDDDDEEDAGDE